MKRKLVHIFVVAGLLSATSCYKDDIDGLQKKVDELEQKVSENTKTIQEQILSQITALQGDIKTLQLEDSKLSEELSGVSDDLKTVKEDVGSNSKLVYYGSLISDADYAAYKDAGADVVTGNVIVRNADDAATLSNCRWVGSDLTLQVGTIEGLKNVGGNLIIESDATSIDVKGLLSVGGNIVVPTNAEMTEFILDDLIVLTGNFILNEGNVKLAKLSFAKLELVGNIFMSNEDNASSEGNRAGILRDINFNSARVIGNLNLDHIINDATAGGSKLSFGTVGGDIILDHCGVETFELLGETLGNLKMIGNTIITVDLVNAITINGDVELLDNSRKSGGGPVRGVEGSTYIGLEVINADNLETINGDIIIDKNRNFSDIFNTVKTINGDIDVFFGSNDAADIILFEELTTIDGHIEMTGILHSLRGFNELTSISASKYVSIGTVDDYMLVYEDAGLNLFNELVTTDAEIKINSKYYSYTSAKVMDLDNSFNALTYVKRLTFYLASKSNEIANGFKSLATIGTLELNGEKDKMFDLDLSLSFDALKTIEGNLDVRGGFTKLEGLNVESIDQIKLPYNKTMELISFPELTTITSKYGVKFYAYANVTFDFPKLVSSKVLYFEAKVDGVDITVNMPELTTCTDITFKFYNRVPNSINAELPKLDKVNKLLVSVKKKAGTMDFSNVLTNLKSFGDSPVSAKLYYNDGQTFCGFADFILSANNNDGVTKDKLSLYKDGSYKVVSEADENAEVVAITNCSK